MNDRRVVYADDTHCQCVVGNVFVLYTKADASSGNIDQLCRHFDRFAAASKTEVACIIVTDADTRPPNGEDRDKVSKTMAKHAAKLSGLAIVLRASGFKGAIIRSVAAGIFVLPNPGYPTKFFPNAELACRWVGERIDKPASYVDAAVAFAVQTLELGAP